MVKVKNTCESTLRERLFGIGLIVLEPGEVREIPKEVADLWLNPKRQKVCIEVYVEPEVIKEEVKTETIDLTPTVEEVPAPVIINRPRTKNKGVK